MMIIIFNPWKNPNESENLVTPSEWTDHQSGQKSAETKLSCNRMELKRISKTEIRWNEKVPSR